MRPIQFMMITNVPEIARHIVDCGVERIFVDMEYLGKDQRQKNLNLPQHRHTYSDVTKVKAALNKGEVMLRINPFHSETTEEVQRAIDAGADCLMLPFFHTRQEVEGFVAAVDGRVKTNILLETACAAGRAEQILSVPGVDEVHIGLNDLKISLRHDFLFESFAGGLVDHLCNIARKNKLSCGIGGIGRIGKELLPAELILKEHVRLQSDRVILSRVFHNNAQTLKELNDFVDFGSAIADLRRVEEAARTRTPEQESQDRRDFQGAVELVSHRVRASTTEAAPRN